MSQGATTGGSQAPLEAAAGTKDQPAGKEQRVTKQRLAVSAALDELDDFVSTQELHRILQERGTAVSLATSYRIVQSLADEGLVDVLRNADGEVVYRRCAVTGHHHHLMCRNCGKAVEVEAPAVEAWAARPLSMVSLPWSTRWRFSGCAPSAPPCRGAGSRFRPPSSPQSCLNRIWPSSFVRTSSEESR